MAKAKTVAPAARPGTTVARGNGAPPATGRVSAKTTAVAQAQALEAEIAGDSGRGFEEAGREAYAVPFLRVLQDLSPQVKSKMPGYVPGAKPGMIFNTVTQKFYDSVRVIPCHFTQSFIEWAPERGGFVASHPPGTALVREAVREGGKNILPNGNELMDTRSHFVLLLDEEEGTHDGALIAMSSTGLKISRRWMSQMRAAVLEVEGRIVQPPMFAWSYLLSSEEEANDKGSWYQWVVADRARVEDPVLYRAAKQFGATMKSGAVKVNYEEELRQTAGQGAPAGSGVPEDLGTDNTIGGM
jgi:hypothetical protein